MSRVQRCHRCGRRYRGSGNWNVEMKDGRPQFLLCPSCQTPEENAEAEINEATLRYGVDVFGRGIAVPK